MTPADVLALTQNITPLDAGAHVTAMAWLGDTAAFALGDGNVLLARDGASRRVAAHPDGAVLVAASDVARLATGGEDGTRAVTGADGPVAHPAPAKGRDAVLRLHMNSSAALRVGRRGGALDDT